MGGEGRNDEGSAAAETKHASGLSRGGQSGASARARCTLPYAALLALLALLLGALKLGSSRPAGRLQGATTSKTSHTTVAVQQLARLDQQAQQARQLSRSEGTHGGRMRG